ncbi:MAG: ATPase, T2SS/T4P/T4SS family [Planctomycetota bacterium]
MQIWYNHIIDASDRQSRSFTGRTVHIGRSPENDIVLDSPFVAAQAVVLERTPTGWECECECFEGVHLADRELTEGERVGLKGQCTLKIYPYTLSIDIPDQYEEQDSEIRRRLDGEWSKIVRRIHLTLLQRMDLTLAANAREVSSEELLRIEHLVEDINREVGLVGAKLTELDRYIAGCCLHSLILSKLFDESSQGATDSVWNQKLSWTRLVSAIPDREEEFAQLIDHINQEIPTDDENDLTKRIEAVERYFWTGWRDLGKQIHPDLMKYLVHRFVKKQIKDIVFGYGPLEDLLRSPVITEIMVVDSEHIFFERAGILENSGRRFVSDEVTQAIIERIVARVGRRIDKSKPLVDARLVDGSRVNAIIAPLAVSGPCLTIRKFPPRKMGILDLVKKGSLTPMVSEFIRACVLCRCNIIISGGTGTGKTTLLNCLSDFIPDRERIVTIEDTAELQLNKTHLVRLETKQENIEGTGAYTIRDLVKNSLRMRPDRIVVGECRGAESLDMLQAMNTGHDGSLTTLHANTSEDVILRLEVMVQMAAPLPIDSIHRQIGSAVDLIIQLSRQRSGRRVITQVTECVGVDPHKGGLILRDIFNFDEATARLVPTGQLPTFMDRILATGKVDLDAFFLDHAPEEPRP